MLGTSVRVSFFGAEQKAIEEWVQSCASRARREAQMAQGSSTSWLQPGLYISRLTRDVLHQLRSLHHFFNSVGDILTPCEFGMRAEENSDGRKMFETFFLVEQNEYFVFLEEWEH
jgi:hypothetical protein